MQCGFLRLLLKSIIILLSSAALFLLPKPAFAQLMGQSMSGANGKISVRVHDGDGSPIGGSAMVTLRSPSQLTNVSLPTTGAGQAVFEGLHAGDYTVEVTAPGYRTVQVHAIIAADQEVEDVDVVMVSDSGGRSQAPGSPILAPKALKETEKGLQALQADKAQRTPTQQKLDCQLLFAARLKATGIVHPAAPMLRPAVKAEADGRIKVDIKGTVTPDLLAAIANAGGTVLSSLPSRWYPPQPSSAGSATAGSGRR